MASPWKALNDAEGESVPDGLRVVDAHVHLFPDRVFQALWRWFDVNAWPVRYPLTSELLIEFLQERGVWRMLGLTYAHKPGMARSLNEYVAELADRYESVIGVGTVMPGEPESRQILREAFGLGLAGVKIHCHVQCVSPDAPEMDVVYEEAARAGKPVIIHAGREPACAGYACDPRSLCSVGAIERVLARHPDTTVIVPHMGADEVAQYVSLLSRFSRLYLDTTMMVAGYFDVEVDARSIETHSDRILYGTDFPNLPFAWDRELRWLAANLSEPALKAVASENAVRLFGL